MSISAMKQALEALELALNSHNVFLTTNPMQDAWQARQVEPQARQAITALRQAIAEAEKQEPVAWEGIRETVELRGSHSEEYEEGFWAGLRAYEDKLREQDWYGQHQWQCGYERGWDAAMEQKREWVGLTDEEVFLIREYPECCEVSIRNAEAKLKKKNT
jgi:hypothetical protein